MVMWTPGGFPLGNSGFLPHEDYTNATISANEHD